MADCSRPHICQCLNRLLSLRRFSTVTITGDRRKTGEQFVESVLSLAHKLSHLGLQPGHVVAICAFNSDWYLEWMLAVAYVGGIIAPLNYRWSLEESKVALQVIQPAMIVTDECCTWLSELQNGTMSSPRWHVSIGFHYSNGIQGCERLLLEPRFIKYCWAPEDVVIICFTSGSTGRPKGVVINHTSLIMQSLAKIAVMGYTEDDVYLHTAPLCHIGGISSCLAMLMAGGCHVLIPKFEVKMAVKAIEESHVTSLITVPAILASLVSMMRDDESRKTEQGVKKILNGGGSLSAKLIEDAIICFGTAKLLSAYGMTETCSSLTFIILYDPATNNPAQRLKHISEVTSDYVHPIGGLCVGKPAPHVEIMITQEEPSQVGRIMTRGPHVMIGYWGQHSAFDNDAGADWFDTGDSGHIDAHGNLWLVGRRNCRIKSGGENVYPEEVEVILSQHPGILAAMVIGLPHDSLGEMVVACIQIKESWIWTDLNVDELPNNVEWQLSTVMLKEYCRRKSLTGFKIPKGFMVWRKPFPLTSTGKVKRDQVKAEAVLHLQPLLCNL